MSCSSSVALAGAPSKALTGTKRWSNRNSGRQLPAARYWSEQRQDDRVEKGEPENAASKTPDFAVQDAVYVAAKFSIVGPLDWAGPLSGLGLGCHGGAGKGSAIKVKVSVRWISGSSS